MIIIFWKNLVEAIISIDVITIKSTLETVFDYLMKNILIQD